MQNYIYLFLGEATGIGPEITAKVIPLLKDSNLRLIICGTEKVLKQGMKFANLSFKYKVYQHPAEIKDNLEDVQPLLEIGELAPENYLMGEIDHNSSNYTMNALQTIIEYAKMGYVSGFVYAPLNKKALFHNTKAYNDEFAYFSQIFEGNIEYSELNYYDGLWISRVTSHIPFKDITKFLTEENMIKAINSVQQVLIKTKIIKPKIGIAALNPHAGENGLHGDEEKNIIKPVVLKARKQGINVMGPFPADTIFMRAFQGEFDAIITLYHDQGQIAVKTKQFNLGVTMGQGFPIPIMTPAHGTAFDIAGKGQADPTALREAIKLCDLIIRQ